MKECKAEVEVYRRPRLSYATEDEGAGLCHAIHACTCKRHTLKPPDSCVLVGCDRVSRHAL
jgi:hypothetical protein